MDTVQTHFFLYVSISTSGDAFQQEGQDTFITGNIDGAKFKQEECMPYIGKNFLEALYSERKN